MNTKPNVILSSRDLGRLEALLDKLPADHVGGQALQEELIRAEVMEPEQMPPAIVTMNSTVRFAIEASGEEFCQTLVYPKDADGSSEHISILAPIGSALLGLSAGDRIKWPRPDGGATTVRIKEIVGQPERDGEFHR